MSSASIHDFPDAGVIYALEDHAGPNGYASVLDVATALGLEDGKALGRRLGWMRRYGMVERHRHDQGYWRPTRKGDAAVRSSQSTLDLIVSASGVEFDLLRRTVQYARFNTPRRKR